MTNRRSAGHPGNDQQMIAGMCMLTGRSIHEVPLPASICQRTTNGHGSSTSPWSGCDNMNGMFAKVANPTPFPGYRVRQATRNGGGWSSIQRGTHSVEKL